MNMDEDIQIIYDSHKPEEFNHPKSPSPSPPPPTPTPTPPPPPDYECSICMELIPANYFDSFEGLTGGGCPFGHKFHLKCIARWRRPTCPMCRSTLSEAAVMERLRLVADILQGYKYIRETTTIDGRLRGMFYYRFYQAVGPEEMSRLPRELINEWPAQNANKLAIEYWNTTPPVLQEALFDFVINNHICDADCDESNCFFKNLGYC